MRSLALLLRVAFALQTSTRAPRVRAPRGAARYAARQDEPTYLDTLTRKVQETLLGQTLEIQVPGPGAAREGDFFASDAPKRTLTINADLLNWRAKRDERRGRVDAARALWRRAVAIDKYDGRAYIALARDLETRRRDPARASELLAESLRLVPENAYVRQAYGVLLERRGRRREALDQLRLATAYDPSHVASHVATARLLTRDLAKDSDDLKREETEAVAEARQCFKSALKARPRDYYALSAAADLEARMGEVDAARRLFRRSVQANPRNAATLVAWANLEATRGEGLERARELYAKAHRAHSTNTRVFTAWAVAEARAGNATGATRLLRKATRAGGFAPGGITDAAVFSTLGEICWHHLEDHDRAADAFRRSVAVDATHAAGYYKWATMELRRGRRARARDLLQQGIWGCTGAAPPVELAKLHRAKGQLEADRAVRRRAREGYVSPDERPAWHADAEGARAAFRKA
eukprot:CAMPEP_0119294620 /NCGR_PEP_ID=MMETSP1329-20130426/48356_1 /TAXON_ID=114041 /ORGANISM="Genus nov. species nov., Strain RCC1024" /LENGTH=467 /DNA_ID=CAMNT_0007295517 /DNA_START=84 /DNA_END=1483 /DNA_ORIENTATION=+